MTGYPPLLASIREEIAQCGGTITFCRFMELALYHPQHGYYTRGAAKLGRNGDYFTSVSVGPLFGQIIARQLALWNVSEVTEFGGHTGQLRQDVLTVLPGLTYRVIEVGDVWPERFRGCVLSNEFLDALPVHRLCGEQEVYVTDGFRERLGPRSDPRLPALPPGYRSEINLQALDWLTAVSARMEPGTYLLTFDYGLERTEYFAPHHATGHLQCYYRHKRHTDPYRHIGEQDITAHVEFTSLIEHGERLGLETVRFGDQGRYLLEVGEPIIAALVEREAGRFSHLRNQLHQLTHPALMGRAFKVLIQRKRPV
ncbi:MAG: SAM-dependent methyltransferase [Verrucomicrobiae bacterium]|nr:SAM-dependent methyltransferase [Verrucomicrobiae bacterium]